jgi:hypothetical protein
MSVKSQIQDKDSPVRRFFREFEKKEGAKNCLALLQSTESLRPLSFTPSSTIVYSFMGTTTDYLIRYTANGNVLQFERTIASEALDFTAPLTGASAEIIQHLKGLFKIGKQNLDGRDASDYKAIYSATALAILDKFFRSGGQMPRLFHESMGEMESILKKHNGKTLKEKATNYLFGEFFATLGGDQYAQDISDLIQLFVEASKRSGSELFGAKMVVFNQALGNSGLVGGADFDCVIECKNRIVLTEIKTKTKPLTIQDLRQILCYALLYDEKKDNFKFTDIGFYHSRSGSFRSLPIDSAVEMTLVGFKSASRARKAFIAAVKKV